MPDVKLRTHAGADVYVKSDGRFYAISENRATFDDQTREGLHRKIDNFLRANARTRAAALKTTVLVLGTEWHDNGRLPTAEWKVGVFAGINAGTGDVTLIGEEGQKITLSHGWFFERPGDRRH